MKINRRNFFASLLTPLIARIPKPEGMYFDLGRPADRYPTYGSVARNILALRLYRQGYVSKESLVNILEARVANAKNKMEARFAQDFVTLGRSVASKGEK